VSGVAVLGPRELVIANEPAEHLDRARNGVDMLAVPRTRLESPSWDGRVLGGHIAGDEAEARAAPICLPVPARGDGVRLR
jgi:hypothetical protein